MATWSIIRQEVRNAIGDSRLRLILLAALVIAAIGGTVAGQDYRSRREQFDTRTAQLKDALAKGRPMGVFATDPALRALRPPEPGSILARGADASLPEWWEFQPAGPVEGSADSTQAEDSQASAIPDFDGVIRVLLSLMAFVVGFESVAGDRSRGVLQSMLNQPVAPRVVVTAKLLAGTIILSGAVLLVTVTLLGAASITAPNGTGRAVTGLAVAVAFMALLYLMSLMAASMVVGSVSTSQAACVATVGALWTYVAIVGPQLMVLGSRALVPVPARQLVEIERQHSVEARQHDTQIQVGKVYESVMGPTDLYRRPLPTPDEAGLAVLGRAWRSEALETRRIVETFDGRFAEQRRKRATVRSWLKWISPGSLLYEATADLADTGAVSSARWRNRIWEYQQYVNEAFFDNPTRVPMYVPVTGGITMMQVNFKLHSDVWVRDLTPFRAPQGGWRARIVASVPELIGLFAYFGVAVTLAYALFPKTGV